MNQIEHNLQCACVNWFRYRYPKLALRLVAVPNGGQRNLVVASKLKREGVTAGVADLVLFAKRGGYGALLLELKTKSGRQSPSQKRWQCDVERDGEYLYRVIRSTDEFIDAVNSYLNL